MKRNKILTVFMAALLLCLSFWAWFKEEDVFSQTERRYLAKLPELKLESIVNGKFMSGFETYTQDQFPLRDSFRALKANASLKLFRQQDNNGLYLHEGHIAQQNYTLNEKMLDNAAEKFRFVYEKYLAGTDTKLYFSIIPEKGMFTEGNLQLDFEALTEYMREKTGYMEYIDIYSKLELDDYYRTDSHWRQEKILDVAESILKAMKSKSGAYELQKTEAEFYGVYAGQLGIDVGADSLNYLENDVIRNCTVTSYNTGRAATVSFYDLSAVSGRDPYEMFLNGADALLVIENPSAKTERELVIFRDSFGSSLAPLLLESYSKVTLVDIRYIQSAFIGNFIDFDNQDVLFIYSSMLLNNSLALK